MASAGYLGLGVHDRPVYTAGLITADSTEIDEIPGVSPLSLAERALADSIFGLKLPLQFTHRIPYPWEGPLH